ncbi:MAG: nucleotide sugar dehydrogenase [Desulfopila sp.]
MTALQDVQLCIIGLGYVGLPLAVEFAGKFTTIGFDRNAERVAELQAGHDSTLEVSQDDLAQVKGRLKYSANLEDITDCNVYIVAVPTPIDKAKRPDFRPLIGASRTVGSCLRPHDVVIYESTVYPGATEEVCVPILEEVSGLTFNKDFFCGYSPERINPGDKEHRLTNIVKVTSGSTPDTAEFVDQLYRAIIDAGTFRASSMKVAEAAKVIENTQRDVNIALVNELSLIFNKLGINTIEVLRAAGTKWNFLPFRPGLVGGHCIGVDPYYLTHKAQEVGYNPSMILAGRRTNDNMGHHIAASVIKLLLQKKVDTTSCRVLVMGLTFKENCPDLRNTRVVDIIDELKEYGVAVDVHDPWADIAEADEEYGIHLLKELKPANYDGIIVTVAHRQYLEMGLIEIRGLCRKRSVIYDVKSIFPRDQVDGSL